MLRLCPLALLLCSVLPTTTLADVPKDVDMPRAKPTVRVVGVYEGTLPPGNRGGVGHPQGTVTVRVTSTKPIILVLTAYEPVLWRIEAPKNVVTKVIASGYHQQSVVGLNGDIPVQQSSYETKDGNYFYAYQKDPPANARDLQRRNIDRQYDRLATQVRALTGLEVSTFDGQYTGNTFELR